MTFTPLDLDLYEDFEIPQGYEAYVLEVQKVTEERADEIEMEYEGQGYKIFHVDLNRAATSIYNLKIIMAKNSFTF